MSHTLDEFRGYKGPEVGVYIQKAQKAKNTKVWVTLNKIDTISITFSWCTFCKMDLRSKE